MTRDQLVDAFDGIDSRFILSAARRIEGGDIVQLHRRKVIRTVLIAAAITVLLAATAYAAGLFGLTARRITPELPTDMSAELSEPDAETMEKVRETHRHSYISLGGVADSPEYSAAAEWLSWRAAHEEEMAAAQLQKGETYYEWRDLERSFAKTDEEMAVARLYGCWDRESLDKLHEIADTHGLKLHTARTRLFDAVIYENLGVYENGSGRREGAVELDGEKKYFEVYTELAGCLPAEELTMSLTDEFTEWEYTTAGGEAVSIAILELSRLPNSNPPCTGLRCFVFWHGEMGDVTVVFSHNGAIDEPEDWQAYAERLADSLDFEAYLKGAQS